MEMQAFPLGLLLAGINVQQITEMANQIVKQFRKRASKGSDPVLK
jgi:hypothetical protein